MQKCNFSHCTACSGDRLSFLFGSIGAMSSVVALVLAYVYYCHGNCV